MDNLNIFGGPKFANPDELSTVDELRRALREANLDLLRFSSAVESYATELSKREEVGPELIGFVEQLMLAQFLGDSNAVLDLVAKRLAMLPRYREKLEALQRVNMLARGI